nr:hypothetical protein [uncultured Carboxylicivirga sp.]
MKYILFILIVILTSCNSSSKKEIESLKKENQLLLNELSSLRNEIDSLEFRAFIIPENNVIKINEAYQAMAGISIGKKSSPITSTILDIDNPSNALYRDISAKIEAVTPGQILITSTKQKPGTYNIVGQINLNIFGKNIERLFSVDYEVK